MSSIPFRCLYIKQQLNNSPTSMEEPEIPTALLNETFGVPMDAMEDAVLDPEDECILPNIAIQLIMELGWIPISKRNSGTGITISFTKK